MCLSPATSWKRRCARAQSASSTPAASRRWRLIRTWGVRRTRQSRFPRSRESALTSAARSQRRDWSNSWSRTRDFPPSSSIPPPPSAHVTCGRRRPAESSWKRPRGAFPPSSTPGSIWSMWTMWLPDSLLLCIGAGSASAISLAARTSRLRRCWRIYRGWSDVVRRACASRTRSRFPLAMPPRGWLFCPGKSHSPASMRCAWPSTACISRRARPSASSASRRGPTSRGSQTRSAGSAAPVTWGEMPKRLRRNACRGASIRRLRAAKSLSLPKTLTQESIRHGVGLPAPFDLSAEEARQKDCKCNCVLHGNQRVAMTRQRKRALDHPTQRKPADQRSAEEQKRSAHAQNGGHDRKGQRMHEYGSGITDGIDRLNGASRTELAPPERAEVAFKADVPDGKPRYDDPAAQRAHRAADGIVVCELVRKAAKASDLGQHLAVEGNGRSKARVSRIQAHCCNHVGEKLQIDAHRGKLRPNAFRRSAVIGAGHCPDARLLQLGDEACDVVRINGDVAVRDHHHVLARCR